MFKHNLRTSSLFAGLLAFLTANTGANANEAYFDISFDRSVNVKTEKNLDKFSKSGDFATLNGKGRLWLTGIETRQGYVEILCQNMSDKPVTVNMVNQSKPWLEIKTPQACGEWSDNLLICPVDKLEKGVFCKISEKNKLDNSSEKDRLQLASVNIRAVELIKQGETPDANQRYIERIIASYSSGIELCHLIHPKTGPVFVNWVIFDGGNVGNIVVDAKTDTGNQAIAECITDNIALWKFPEWHKDSHISYRF